MRFLPAFLLVFVAATVHAVPASDDRRQIDDLLDKAIKARGGADLLRKFDAATWKDKNTMVEGELRVEFNQDGAYCFSGRSRVTTKNGDFRELSVYDGKRGWIERNGEVEEMDETQLKHEREMIHARRVTALYPLGEKEFVLSWLGKVEIDKKPALGILVKHKNFRDVKLFFDKTSHLLTLRETTMIDAKSDKTVPVKMHIGKYKEYKGLLCPTAYRTEVNGATIESELLEFELLEKLDDQLFKKP